MERIGEVVGEQLGRLGAPARIGPVVEAWPRVVGEAIARNAWPARIARDGTLHVATSSSAWAFELQQLEADLLGRLRSALSRNVPPRLRFAPGPLPEPAPAAEPSPRAASSEERAVASRLAATIDDEELRELVSRAAAASLSRAGGRAAR